MRTKIFFALIVLFSSLITANAQKAASVRSFTQTTDFIPGNERRNDLNGTPCALVKVQVVDNIERIEGNKIGDIVKKGVEKWVYMCKGSRNMRVHLSNHLPVRVMFQDYQISGLESNRVYELIIEIPDAPVPVPLEVAKTNATQKLILNYTPLNSMVLVDSEPYQGNGRIELELPVGDHNYIIAAANFITVEGSVKLSEQAPREITENLISENLLSQNPPFQEAGVSSMTDSSLMETNNQSSKKSVVSLRFLGKNKSTKRQKITSTPNPKKSKNKGSMYQSQNTVNQSVLSSSQTVVSGAKNKSAKKQKVASSSIPKKNKKKGSAYQPPSMSNQTAMVSSQPMVSSFSAPVAPSSPLNKSLKYKFGGVTFKCRAKNGYITILGFDEKVNNVVIPAFVQIKNNFYPVVEISTFDNGKKYNTLRLTIPEGVKRVSDYSFIDFYKLLEVTIPNSITEIGKNAFRNNPATKFILPGKVSENDLRAGRKVYSL